jgi:hypothetical protein
MGAAVTVVVAVAAASALPDAAAASPSASGPSLADASAPKSNEVYAEAEGLALGAFAPGESPSPEHPKGTVISLGYDSPSEPPAPDAAPRADADAQFVVEIDLATTREVRRLRLPPSEGGYFIAAADLGVVVAAQDARGLHVLLLDGAKAIRSIRHLRDHSTASRLTLRGVAARGQRIVIVESDRDGAHTHALVLDADARVVASHLCNGFLFSPGLASLDDWGRRIVLTKLSTIHLGDAICAFELEPTSRTVQRRLEGWQEVTFEHGEMLLHSHVSEHRVETQRLDDDLRPVAGLVDWTPPDLGCKGDYWFRTQQTDLVWGTRVVYTASCCGDPGRVGLLLCKGDAGI